MSQKGRDPVEKYALDVLDGRILAGRPVRLACERHLRDLEEGEKRGLEWDWPAAERVIGFFSDVLRLPSTDTLEGRPFVPEPSQEFILGNLFGWKGRNGFRRFRVAFIEIGKGNGKSPLAAGIGVYMTVADGEPRAEVYAAAADKDQAKIIFRDAVDMVNMAPELDKRLERSGGPGKEWNLAYLPTGSFFRPISTERRGRGKSGFRVHCGLLDEVHEHPTDKMVEMLMANTKGRRQALIFMITNSGVDRDSVCWHYHDYSLQVLEGQREDDAHFAYVCALDEGDEWRDPSVWIKTNPLLGVSITEEYLEKQVTQALGMPSKQSIVRRLNFCEWVGSREIWLDPDIWKANGGDRIWRLEDLEELAGRRCWGGLDLSAKNDLSALVFIFEPEGEERAPVMSLFWAPGDGLARREDEEQVPYGFWKDEGLIFAPDGRVIHAGWIAETIGEVFSRCEIVTIGCDPWHLDEMKEALEGIGLEVEMVKVNQNYSGMGPALEVAEEDLMETDLQHGNHPVLTMCVANAEPEEGYSGLRRLVKGKAKGRIDGAIAFSMACFVRRHHGASEFDEWGPVEDAESREAPDGGRPESPEDYFTPVGGFY